MYTRYACKIKECARVWLGGGWVTVGVLWWCGGVSVMTAVTSPVITRASPVVPQANERQLVETKKKKKRKKKKAAGKNEKTKNERRKMVVSAKHQRKFMRCQ